MTAGWLIVLLLLHAGICAAAGEDHGSALAGERSSAAASIDEALARIAAQIQSAQMAAAKSLDGAAGVNKKELQRLERLQDALRQRRDSLREAGQLARALEEARARSRAQPSSSFRNAPPYPVPLLDAIHASWLAQRDQLSRLEQVYEETEAALKVARERADEAERERRRAKQALSESRDPLQRGERERALRLRELDSELAQEAVAAAEIELRNTGFERDIQQLAEQQARAAHQWVESNLSPRASDLEDMLTRLAKQEFSLDRRLDQTRIELSAAASRMEAAQVRSSQQRDLDAAMLRELEATRLEFTTHQRSVALLGERITRLANSKLVWERRYKVLVGEVSPEQGRDWLEASRGGAANLARQLRIKRARLDELQAELGLLRKGALEGATEVVPAAREVKQDTLLRLTLLYHEDIADLEDALRLTRRLEGELEEFDSKLAVGQRLSQYRARLEDFWRYELTTSDDRPITPGKIVTGLLVFAVAWAFAAGLARALGRRVFPRLGLDEGASTAFQSLAFYALIAAGFLISLRSADIPITALAVLGGALAIGVGFGSQTVVSNFISGLILLAERPIKTGDFIEVDGVYGSVESIGLRSTRVLSADNFHIIVPNAAFLERSVVNWTHANTRVRVKVAVGVAYGSPARQVQEILQGVVTNHPACLDHPEPLVLFLDFGASSLDFEARFWITVRNLSDRLEIQSDVRFAIVEAFEAAEIEIAFPQRDVHLDAPDGIDVRLQDGSNSDPADS